MKKKVILFSIFLILFILVVMLFIPRHPALVFYKENTDELTAYLPVEKGNTFHITFTHSIHLTDVVEKYYVTDNLQIRQDEIEYEQFGIGMPANAGAGETFVYDDGKYAIKNINTVFPSMKIRNGKTISKHRLSWGTGEEEKEVRFNDYFEPGDWFTVKIDRLSGWKRLKGVKIGG